MQKIDRFSVNIYIWTAFALIIWNSKRNSKSKNEKINKYQFYSILNTRDPLPYTGAYSIDCSPLRIIIV